MFSIQLPPKVYCGLGEVSALSGLLKGHRHVALFTDAGVKRAGIAEEVRRICASCGCAVTMIDSILPEPPVENASEAIDRYVASKADLIVGVGGGSVMDIAKLASLFDGSEAYTLSSLAEDASPAVRKTKVILIPTTAGTGAEATANAILAFPDRQLKIGIVTPEMMADAVILDARLTRTTPRRVAAAACIDAFAHAIECFTSAKATPLSDLYAVQGMKWILSSAVDGCMRNVDEAREKLLLGAYCGGCAIAGSGTTAVHALSYPLGGKYHIPHGISNAVLLLPVLQFNEPACRSRFVGLYDMLHEQRNAVSDGQKSAWVLACVENLVESLEIPRSLTEYGVSEKDIPELVSAAMKVTRLLNNNLRPVTASDAERIYRQVIS